MVGSAYNPASRNFIETEILVNFDQILVDTPIGTEGMDGSAAWNMVKKDLMMPGYRMEETDFWKLMGIAKLRALNLTRQSSIEESACYRICWAHSQMRCWSRRSNRKEPGGYAKLWKRKKHA